MREMTGSLWEGRRITAGKLGCFLTMIDDTVGMALSISMPHYLTPLLDFHDIIAFWLILGTPQLDGRCTGCNEIHE